MNSRTPTSGLHRRLRKLESQMTDGSGLVPHAEAWFRYWTERFDQFLITGDGNAIQGMTLDFVDAMLARAAKP
jgi:hypothetical protein